MRSSKLIDGKLCEEFTPGYYGVCAIGGMLSAGTTHLAITPLDVLKVNMQNKGDIQNYNYYMGIKLLSHTMKVWQRVVELRLRRIVTISENQFGLMLRRLTTEVIHLVLRLVE
ncbi:hypothetical protein FXO37_04355 [Capsicum annuum]|nr:hypothetical protein FXO37_04355 [Capsicum annuum]